MTEPENEKKKIEEELTEAEMKRASGGRKMRRSDGVLGDAGESDNTLNVDPLPDPPFSTST